MLLLGLHLCRLIGCERGTWISDTTLHSSTHLYAVLVPVGATWVIARL